MISKETIFAMAYTDLEYDLYEENGHIFGVEFNVFSNTKCYYYKTFKNKGEYYRYLKGDIYAAIDQFNSILSNAGDTYEK